MMKDVLFSSKSEEWETPQWLFEKLDNQHHFTLDPCCTDKNAKCTKHYTKEQDGLSKEWSGETVFCNPPYGRDITKWVKKASDESRNPGTKIVMLLPSRTDTAWFHDYIYNKETVLFIRGRLKFGESKNNAPFPSMVVVFDNIAKKKSDKNKKNR